MRRCLTARHVITRAATIAAPARTHRETTAGFIHAGAFRHLRHASRGTFCSLDRNAHRGGDERRQSRLTLAGIRLGRPVEALLVAVEITITAEIAVVSVAAEIGTTLARLLMAGLAFARLMGLALARPVVMARLIAAGIDRKAGRLGGLRRAEGEAIHHGAFKLVFAIKSVVEILDAGAALHLLLGLRLSLLGRGDEAQIMLSML